MDFHDIFNRFCDNLKDVGTISQDFGNLRSDHDRFSYVYDLFTEKTELRFEQAHCKSKSESTSYRNLGNERFTKKLDWEALKLYTRSIALAPGNSDELAIAFGNRASCLLSLGYNAEALEDVNRALNICRDPSYEVKLRKRREKCLEKASSGRNSVFMKTDRRVPKLGSNRNEVLLSASSVVQLQYNKEMGRLLTTTDYIGAGEVLIVEKPYSSILLPEYYYTHCTNCFTRSLTLLPCCNCSSSMFCSQECYEDALNRYHLIECAVLQHLVDLKGWRMEFLSLRILIEASKQGRELLKLYEEVSNNVPNENEYCSDDHLNIYNLVGNTDQRTIPDLFHRTVYACVIIHLLDSVTDFFEAMLPTKKMKWKIFAGGLILTYKQSLPCNAHEISELGKDGLSEIGAAAYATLSLINHSCDPNVVRHSYGDIAVVRAIRPIGAGEQLFDNYGHHYATSLTEERQIALKKQYFFDCQCEACSNSWPLYQYLPKEIVKFKSSVTEEEKARYKTTTCEFEDNLVRVLSGDFKEDMVDSLCRYLNFLDTVVVRPWQMYNKCQEAIKHCFSFTANHFRFTKGVAT